MTPAMDHATAGKPAVLVTGIAGFIGFRQRAFPNDCPRLFVERDQRGLTATWGADDKVTIDQR